MNILHVGKYYPPVAGGIETFLADLARAQAAAGHAVHVLVHEREPFRRVPEETVKGVQLSKALTFGEFVYAPIAPGFGLRLARLIKKKRIDVLHLHMPNISVFWVLLLKPRIPVVIHWHADVFSENMPATLRAFYKLYGPLEKALLKRAERVIVTSPPYLESSRTLQPFREKCSIVPLGMHPERLCDDCKQPVGEMGKIVLSVGRFTYYKGFEYLIRAVAELPGVRLVIAGSGPLLSEMRRLVDELGLEGTVELPGRVDDAELARLLAQCDVFCLPSIDRAEAFGVVLLEAMNAGKPLVTAHVEGSGMSFVNEDGRTGIVVPGRDHRSLAEALQRVLGDETMRNEMGRRGRERFLEHFHIDVVEAAVRRVYDEAMNQ